MSERLERTPNGFESLSNHWDFWPENARVEIEEVNGQAALIIRAGGQVFSVLTMDVEDG